MPHLSHHVNAKIGRQTAVVMGITLLSRIFGFARDIVFAHLFGATAEFDAFVIAFKLPNFMRRLFGEGAFSQAFIPVLVERRIQLGVAGVNALISSMAGILAMILLAVVIVGEIATPVLVSVFAPGFIHDPGRFQLTIKLFRITVPYLLGIGLVALAGAILNSYNRFALTAFTPILLNIMLITAAWWGSQYWSAQHDVIILAWAVALCGLVQLLWQWPAIYRLGLSVRLKINWRDAGVRRVFKRMFPALLGVSVAQISLLLDNIFASFLPVGSLSWLYYSDRLLYFPLGVIGVALSTVVMPHLSHHYHQRAHQQFAAVLDWALRCLLAAAIPAALGLGLLAGPILSTLMLHGAFTARDVHMASLSLAAFSLGLPALMAIKVFAAAFYSQHQISTPARIAGLALLINLVLNLILMTPLAHTGLALATAIACWVNAVLLWLFLPGRGQALRRPGWLRLILGISLGAVMMTVVVKLGQGRQWQWIEWSTGQRLWRLLMLILSGTLSYMIGLRLCGIRWQNFKYSEPK